MEILTKLNESFKELIPSQTARIVVVGTSIFSLLYLRRKILGGRLLSTAGKAVFVTGCDTELGFGRAIALRLHEMGYVVFAGCLDAQTACKTLYSSLISNSDTFQVIQLDITKQDQVDAAFVHVEKWLKSKPNFRFHGVVNNAGIGPLGPLEWTSMKTFQLIFDINTFGVVRVTRTFLPLLRRSGDGRIVVMASLAGEVPAINGAAYSGSKAAVLAIFDALQMEVKKFNVKTSAILPDLYRTNISDSNSDVVAKALDRELVGVNKEAFDAYGGEQGRAKLIRALSELLPKFSKPDISPVITSVVKALGSPHPEKRYYPIDSFNSIMLFLRKIPAIHGAIQEKIFSHIF